MDNQLCHWCGVEVEPKQDSRRKKRFCSDNCRYAYNNELKRSELAWRELKSELARIHQNGQKEGDLGVLSRIRIDELTGLMSAYSTRKAICKNCGQSLMFWPSTGQKCNFCGESDWRYKVGE
jgi:hypothetical protein